MPSQAVKQNCLSKLEGASSTAFQEDGAVVSGTTRSVPSMLDLGPPAYDQNQIADFLSKPIMIAQGNLSTSSSVGTQIAAGTIANSLTSNALWVDKIKGYNLIRATAHIKVVVNANPFQAGRLLLTFLPCFDIYSVPEKRMRFRTLAQMTTQPNVELDVQDSSCELAIPYVTPFPYYEVMSQIYDWGEWRLFLLSPLNTGATGPSTAPYAVFLWFDDVQLAAPVFPQSATEPVGNRSRRRRNFGALKQEEEAQAKKGIISNTLSVVSSSMMNLGSLPGIGSYAASLGSATAIGSKIAAMFGYSKPIDSTLPHPMYRLPFKNLHTTDGSATSSMLALHSSVNVDPLPDAFGSSVDEMSVAFLKAIPAYWGRFTWSNAALYGTQLWQNDVDPLNFLETSTQTLAATTVTYKTGQPLFMLAHFFLYWRGGFEITLKFVKTKFHTGRLIIAFTPQSVSPSIANSPYVLREIIDLSTANEVTLKIPYLRSQSWLTLPTQSPRTVNSHPDDISGAFNVMVLDPLRAPETASSSIEVLMYVRPGDDFELAVPTGGIAAPFAPESGMELRGSRTASAVENTELISKPIGNASELAYSYSHGGACIGDPFVSIKQLVTAARKFYSSPAGYPGTTITMNPSPSVVFLQDPVTGLLGPPGGAIYGDWLSIVTSAYAFCRGGYRIINANPTPGLATYNFVNETVGQSQIANTVPTVFTPDCDSGPNVMNVATAALQAHRDLNSGADIIVPHFGRTPIRLNRFLSGIYPYLMSPGLAYPDIFNTRVAISTTSENAAGYLRAGADDFCLGYFIGFPPLAVSVTTL